MPFMNDRTQLTFAARVGRISRLVRKETTGALRDRRTIVTLFLMPILLYPLLAICFKQFFLSQQADEAPPVYRIGFGDEKAASAIVGYLSVGRDTLARLVDSSSGSAKDPQARLDIRISDDVETSLREGLLDLIIRPVRPGVFEIDPQRDLHEQWELTITEDSRYGRDALHHIERLVSAGNEAFLRARLNSAGIRQSTFPVVLCACRR